MKVKGANRYVRELAAAVGLKIQGRPASNDVALQVGAGTVIGLGPDLISAVRDALRRQTPEARRIEQALFMLGALACGPAELFRSMEALWGGEDDGDPDSGPVIVRRG